MKNFFIASSLILAVTCAVADPMPSLGSLQAQINSLQQSLNQQAQASQSAISTLQSQLNQINGQLQNLAAPDAKKFNWVSSDNGAPANAFVAAQNGTTPVYICQATYTGDNTYGNAVVDPGVLTTSGCVITYGGQAYLAPQYSVLVSSATGYWIDGSKVKTTNNYPPIRPLMLAKDANAGSAQSSAPSVNPNQPTPLYNQFAIIGGNENGQNVYICRTQIGGQYFVGKVNNNTCYIASGNAEASWPQYEVLLFKQPAA